MSALVENITGSRVFGFLARTVLTSMFWLSGIAKLADFDAGVAEMAQAIAAMPPLAAIANKEAVNAAFETGLHHGLLFERRSFNGLCASADKAEGMAAFVEKRPGVWTGR